MKSRRMLVLFWVSVAALSLASARRAAAQQAPPPASAPAPQAAQQTATGASPTLRLTLEDALARARKNSTQFQAAQTDASIARQDRYQAGAALLPSVTYNNEALYTQLSNNNPRFIANNAAHEYVSQANVHEFIDLVSISAFRRASAASALAKARAEIASRGLVVAVVQSYYAVAAAQLKLEAARKNGDERSEERRVGKECRSGRQREY